MSERRVVWFYILAFGISWASWVLAALFHIALNTLGFVVSGVSALALACLQVLAACALIVTVGGRDLTRARVRAG